VKISNFSNLKADALDEDPIVATSRFAVGENSLLDDNDVDTVDAYGNVSNNNPEYGVSSEIGVATVNNRISKVTYDEDDVGQTDTITVAVAGLEERELQIVTIVESLTATALLCSREGPAAALNSGEVILKIKANGNTAENREIQVAIDTDNSVADAELRDLSGGSIGTSTKYTLNAGTPVDEVLRLVVSAPAAGDVVVQASDVEGLSEILDTGSITIPFTELEKVVPTASIAPEEGSSVSPASSIVITVKDNYGVSLKNTVYSIKKDGSDITRSLTCGNAGEGTKEGTITCGKEPVGAAYSWENMAAGSTAPGEGLDEGSYVVTATPQDLLDNTGSKVTSNFTVAVCTPVVTIDPASALLPLGGTQQFSASTSCDGTSPAGTYTWDIMTRGCTGSTIISSSGLYTAPDSISGTSCTDMVRVTDTANGNATATAEVTVSEITTTTTSTDGNAVITVIPDPMLRSRWVMIPVVMRIQGENTNFTILQSRVSFSPSNAVVPMPRLVVGKRNILQLIFVNPPWLAGGATEGTLEVTVTTGSEVVTDTVNIQMLPLGLDK
jgi:hypothetical protein